MQTVTTYLQRLVQETQKSEAEVITQAIESGLRQLWRERVLACFLRGELSREEAIEAVGIDWVDLAERQHAAMLEDLDWALNDL